MVEAYLLFASVIAFVITVALLTGLSVGEALGALIKWLGNKPVSPNWLFIIAGGWLPLVTLLLFAAYLYEGNVVGTVNSFIRAIFYLPVVAAVLVLPVLPILYVRKKSHLKLTDAIVFVTALLALPLAAIVAFLYASELEGRPHSQLWILTTPQASTAPPCQTLIDRVGFRHWQSAAEAGSDENILFASTQFWYDNTLKALLFDFSDMLGCDISWLRHDRHSLAQSAIVMSYRLFVANFILSLVFVFGKRAFTRNSRRRNAKLWVVRQDDRRSMRVTVTGAGKTKELALDEEMRSGQDRRLHLYPGDYRVRMRWSGLVTELDETESITLDPKSQQALVLGVTGSFFDEKTISRRLVTATADRLSEVEPSREPEPPPEDLGARAPPPAL